MACGTTPLGEKKTEDHVEVPTRFHRFKILEDPLENMIEPLLS
jgi:hypothetical protein